MVDLKNSLQPLATVILTRCFQHCVLNQCLFSLSLFSLTVILPLALSLPALLLVPMRTRPLNVTARRRMTRHRPSKRPSRERSKPTHLPGRSIWWLVFTPTITKQQSKPSLRAIQDLAVLKTMWLTCFSCSSPSQSQELCGESVDYSPGEHEYSLLPAPIHVGERT